MAKERQIRLFKPTIEVGDKAGYIKDYITGKLVRVRPEEVEARQIFEKRLVEEYGYSKDQIEIEFLIQKGSQKIGPADIVVFRDSKKTFDNIYVIVETKRKESKSRLDQAKHQVEELIGK